MSMGMAQDIVVGAELDVTVAGTPTKFRVSVIDGDSIAGELKLFGRWTAMTMTRTQLAGGPSPREEHPSGTRTTAPSDFDVSRAPAIAEQRSRTVRLHPRRGDAAHDASKLCGVFLWPADEPWPRCTEPEWPQYTRDPDTRDRHDWPGVPRSPDHPLHNDHYVPVLQLRADEFPELEFPDGMDLFQLLWCPRAHGPAHDPICRVFWRSSGDIADTLDKTPTASQADRDLVPDPCFLNPERVDEYPSSAALTDEQRAELAAVGPEATQRYTVSASVAPGTKLGGHVPWMHTPDEPVCRCGATMRFLLTIGSREFDASSRRWCPTEDRGDDAEDSRELMNPTGLCIGDAGDLHLFVCRACDDAGAWPIAWRAESS